MINLQINYLNHRGVDTNYAFHGASDAHSLSQLKHPICAVGYLKKKNVRIFRRIKYIYLKILSTKLPGNILKQIKYLIIK